MAFTSMVTTTSGDTKNLDVLTKHEFSVSGLPEWIRLTRKIKSGAMSRGQITYPDDVVKLLRPILDPEESEIFLALCLDSKRNVRAIVEVSRGVLTGSLVHPREVYRVAIAFNSGGIIVAHNHPSGDPSPSPEDREITNQLSRAGSILGIPLLDHIIIAGEKHVSMKGSGLI